MEQALEIVIKGDVVQVTKSLDDLQKEFTALEKQLKTKTGQAFVDANKELDKLRITMDKVKNIGRTGFDKFGDSADQAGKGIKKVGAAAGDAAPALASMGQVARDLPFGFIAIQNNLPIMADQFTNLIKASKGVGGALKALGGALLGPAGISFALGAIIALVTGLINKYGSLGNAIDELFKSESKHAKLMKEVAEVNKAAGEAAGTEIARFRFLADTMQNTALAMDVRTDAMKKMKDEYGVYLQNLKDEDLLNGDLKKSTEDVTTALIAKAVATAAVAKASALSGQIAANTLQDAEDLKEITRLQAVADKQAASTQGKAETSGAAGTRRDIEALKASIVTRQKENKVLEENIAFFLNLAQAKNQAAGAGAISEDSPEERAAKEKAARDKIQAAKDKEDRERLAAEKKIQEIQKGRIQAELKGINDQIKKVGELTQAWLSLGLSRIDMEEQLALIGETDPQTIQTIKDNAKAARKALVEAFKTNRTTAGKLDFTSIFDLDPVAAGKRWADFLKEVKANAARGASTAPDLPEGPLQQKIPEQKKEIRLSDSASKAVQTMISDLALMTTKTEAAASAFATVLAPAIDAAFGALAEGRNVIQQVGEAMKRLVIQIAATVVKAAILAAILSVISGGSANAAKGGKSFGEFFTGMLKGLAQAKSSTGGAGAGFTGAASSALTPSFSGFGGGMAIQITGELTGRGTDLVATLDNANARIRRTG